MTYKKEDSPVDPGMEDPTDIFPAEEDVPPSFRVPFPIPQAGYLIKGKTFNWKNERFGVWSPIYLKKSGKPVRRKIGSSAALTRQEALAALDAAKLAFDQGRGEWPRMSLSRRIEALEDFLLKMIRKKKDILRLLMWEVAKPYAELEDEFERTISFARQAADSAEKEEKNRLVPLREKEIVGLVRDDPCGIALCMGPYNYPLFETFSLVFPALLMGNAVIIKTPPFGTLFFQYLLEDFRDGFPAGVVNVLSGDGPTIIDPLMASGEIDVFAFIGSSRVANRLLDLHPRKNRLRYLLGLEAKNVGVVMADADMAPTIRESVLGALAFNGQRCAALKIFFVHEDILDRFLDSMTGELEQIKTGMPWQQGVRITPLVDPGRIPFLKDLVVDARRHGSRILNRNGGRFFKSIVFPTLCFPVNSKMKIYSVEQFGPVIPVVPFDDPGIPLNYLRGSRYGQQMSLFGGDTHSLKAFLDRGRNQVSRVNINMKCQRGPDSFPFTGKKDSAHGDFAAAAVLSAFSTRSTLALRAGRINERILNDLQLEEND